MIHTDCETLPADTPKPKHYWEDSHRRRKM